VPEKGNKEPETEQSNIKLTT